MMKEPHPPCRSPLSGPYVSSFRLDACPHGTRPMSIVAAPVPPRRRTPSPQQLILLPRSPSLENPVGHHSEAHICVVLAGDALADMVTHPFQGLVALLMKKPLPAPPLAVSSVVARRNCLVEYCHRRAEVVSRRPSLLVNRRSEQKQLVQE